MNCLCWNRGFIVINVVFDFLFVKILSIFVIQRQIKIMKRIKYIQPECDFESDKVVLELVCQSPVDGGLEGTKDEDWVI